MFNKYRQSQTDTVQLLVTVPRGFHGQFDSSGMCTPNDDDDE